MRALQIDSIKDLRLTDVEPTPIVADEKRAAVKSGGISVFDLCNYPDVIEY